MDRAGYLADGVGQVPGWLTRTDALLFDAVDSAQRQAGVRGDLLEIGCYQGASAVLLGYMRRDGERLLVCDVFDGATTGPEDDAERARFYVDPTRATFEARFREYHDELPAIHAGPSSTLWDLDLARSFRFIHIDGSHVYDNVRSDLLLAQRLLVPGGVVAFDDIVSVHTPGVGAAVWEGVIRDGLVPLLQSTKLFATWGPPLAIDLPEGLAAWSHNVLGHRMLHVEGVPG